MIAQGLIIQDGRVLMVKQYVERGDMVWNFPGGGIEEGEIPEEACIREVKEETGYNIQIIKKLYDENGKYTFLAEIIGGTLFLDETMAYNQDIIEVKWVSLEDTEKFDAYTIPIICLYQRLIL